MTELAVRGNGHGTGALTAAPEVTTLPAQWKDWTRDNEAVDLVQRHFFGGDGTELELDFFLGQCRRTRLDPIARQIYPVFRFDGRQGRKVMSIQTSIDGFRLIAARSGEYEGQVPTLWCGKDGKWTDIWTADEPPFAAKVGVWRKNFREPLYGVAHFREYAQTDKNGKPTGMWERMSANQIAKCAEAKALRMAFPDDLSALYTSDEMGQAENAGGQDAAPSSNSSTYGKNQVINVSPDRQALPETKPARPSLSPEIVKVMQAFQLEAEERGLPHKVLDGTGRPSKAQMQSFFRELHATIESGTPASFDVVGDWAAAMHQIVAWKRQYYVEPGDEPLAAATPLPEVVAAPHVVTAPTVVASVQTATPAEDDDIIQDDDVLRDPFASDDEVRAHKAKRAARTAVVA